ncbi:MAG: potassium-transporting ATPase subunit KdpA [Planctomycetes bacterium]|nr:potassium-transporting ATPase subunit KdpA [Planctomycetota bacterium]
MNAWDWAAGTASLLAMLALSWPLGIYMGRIFRGSSPWISRWLRPLERVFYRAAGLRCDEEGRLPEMTAGGYARALLLFSALSLAFVYGLQRLHHLLPLHPPELGPVPHELALNTAISFVTNTNWQSYGGETTLSPLTQMLGLGVQNFVSAAVGLAVMAALARGLWRQGSSTIGNFWSDLVRSVLYVLLPLSTLLALLLVGQGVVQSFAAPAELRILDPELAGEASEHLPHTQLAPVGPVASQVAIKQLGTNGGGYFNTNSAHPFENPTPLSNWLQWIAILLLPAACCAAFGEMVRDRRQGLALLAAMTLVLVPALVLCSAFEAAGNPALRSTSIAETSEAFSVAGNLEGKETRFGVAASAWWAVATTAASNGSVNSMHDSFTPLGGLIPLWLMQLGEVIFGGVGSGLYGMLLFVLVAIFVGGLLIGRTPEYFAKKVEPFEMKMATLGIIGPAACVLLGAALAVSLSHGRAGIQDPGFHGFSEVLYAFSSASNNNGSAFAGLSANSPFYNLALGLCMLVGRFAVIGVVLAIAGSMARKRRIALSAGSLPTHTPLFVVLLLAVVLLVGALSFLPALALGPIAEQLELSAVK